ncbi:DUF2946 domain-containing protein [Bradyrhizobium sp. STM 3562]|uniref:DUF2946 domain-containing protein n=1 Tax=Bradyrhizobium sp. STM 3562 TaxID=578924 RepID=UPI00388DEB47
MQRLQRKFLPVLLIALVAQILAPIVACWATAAVTSDPLQIAQICHGAPGGTSGGSDQGDPRAHDEACILCCAVQASASGNAPQQAAFTIPYRQTTRVVWSAAAPRQPQSRIGSNTQARAPPLPM